MIWRLTLAACLTAVIACFGLGERSVKAQFNGCPAGFCSGQTAAIATYVGPGDIVSGATDWWGLRGYSAAYSTGSNRAATVCDAATFAICTNINILANGNFDTATASSSASCISTCVVSILTDQAGGGSDLACSSASVCPTLTFNCLGSLPCLTFGGAQNIVVLNSTYVTPTSFSSVHERTGNFSVNQGVGGNNVSNLLFLAYLGTGNQGAVQWISGNFVFPMTDSVLHAAQIVYNGSSSSVNIDNTITPGSTGTGNLTAIPVGMGLVLGSDFLTGIITEQGYWSNVAFNTTQQTNLNHNQCVYWGTAGPC